MKIIKPQWDAPSHIHGASSTRQKGIGKAPYDGLNLGAHVGDVLPQVEANRASLKIELQLPTDPLWLNQVHSNVVLDLDGEIASIDADAVITRQKGTVCTIMTADCLPVLLTDKKGSVVAAAHAGWRGLCDGILEKTVTSMQVEPSDILAWLGPAISQQWFEVGEEVRQQFIDQHAATSVGFIPSPNQGKWMADIYQLATIRLNLAGVVQVMGGKYCTYSDPEQFFSYRRDGVTGRMASLIWMG